MITPQKLLLSIAATAAGFALVLGSMMFDAASTTATNGAEVARVSVVAPRLAPTNFLYQFR